MKNIEAFITGSHAYGIPREDSDVDLVVLMSYDALEILSKQSDKIEDGTHAPSDDTHSLSSASLRFGKLNIIALTDLKDYEAWKKGTQELKSRDEPVSRDDAITIMRSHRKK